MKILIIDDEKDYCTLLQLFFMRRGVEVTVCHLLGEGLKLLSESGFDCVILDNNLPDGMGWDLAAEIADKYNHTQLILISAYPRRHNAPLPTQARVLEKPISNADLQKMIALN